MACTRLFLLGFLALGSVVSCGAEEPIQESTQPNVVVILLDTLRSDALGFNGYDKPTSPFLDSIAPSFAVFDRAYSTSSWTAPACASLFTGHYPPAHGITEGFFAYRRRMDKAEDGTKEVLQLNRFADDMKLMPEYFQEAGYRTYGIATNLNIGPELGFDRGFDRFECIDDGTAPVVLSKLSEWETDIQNPTASEDKDKPYFLYLHFMDVHKPYHAREPFYEESEDEMQDLRNRYDSELRYLDGHLKTIFEKWGWGDETLMVVLSDHGEEFGEHGQQGHRYGPIYRETNQILMMFRGPGVTGGRIASVAGIHDVLPTLMSASQLGEPQEGTGLNLMPLLSEASLAKNPAWRDRTVFAHRSRFRPSVAHQWAANYRHYRFIQEAGTAWFFDVAKDPNEITSILSRKPTISQRVRRSLQEHRDLGFGNRAQPIEVEVDSTLSSILGELGYSDEE